MKKLNTILMILALLLSIGVRSAPVESSGAKVSVIISGTALIVSGILVGLGVGGVTTGLSLRSKKMEKKRRAKIKKIKKKARAALRKRAEAEYDHRHAPHRWQ
jgi:hypothetical protein